jgi:hypothetical protein
MKAPAKRRKKRLSHTQRWLVGGDCATLYKKQALENAERDLLKKSKHAGRIKDELKILQKSIKQGDPRAKVMLHHSEKMSKLARPDTKRLYNLPMKANKSAIVRTVAKEWQRRGHQASEKTVYRCWKDFEALERFVTTES